MLFLASVTRAGATEIDIDQVGQRFSRPSLALQIGSIVRFLNQDDVTHNISIINEHNDAIDEGLQRPGQNIVVLLDKNGRFTVRCSIHPRMKMVISID